MHETRLPDEKEKKEPVVCQSEHITVFRYVKILRGCIVASLVKLKHKAHLLGEIGRAHV
jgi:hypothetical protein